MKSSKLVYLPLLLLIAIVPASFRAQTTSNPANLPQRDGSHDFDFLIGNWKTHVRRLPDRLNNSNSWVEYDGFSNHKKLLDSNANFEEFDVTSTDKKLRIKAQTLRLYNPVSHQWSIYLVDVDNGTLGLPPVVGQFTGNRGEFFDQEDFPQHRCPGDSDMFDVCWLWSCRNPGAFVDFAEHGQRDSRQSGSGCSNVEHASALRR